MHLAPDKLNPGAVALFLDVDGTLLDIRDHPADVQADDELLAILADCFDRLGGAMSLISGRPVDDVDRIFGGARYPVAGAHGAELRRDGRHTDPVASEPMSCDVVRRVEAFVADNDGLLLERKRGGLSLHYRRAPGLESDCRDIAMRVLRELGDRYRLIAGKMVFEIAPSAHNKGAAIRAFLEDPPFAGRMPIFLGDDVTDEDGFRAVNELNGLSIRIGDASDSEATFSLPDVGSVRPWLRRAILGEQPGTKKGEKKA